jgi:hypothetical protein
MLVAFLAMLSTGIFAAHILEALNTGLSSVNTRRHNKANRTR